MYKKMEFLYSDDETLGCYIEGHYDMEQFTRVAVDFLKTECDMDVSKKYREAKKGYYKVIPHSQNSFYHFSKQRMRGSKPIMEMRYL